MATLHVHLDESGNLGFNARGTRYYVFAVAWTYDPASLAAELINIRFSLLKNGHNIEAFHATKDKQINRDAVISALARQENWRFSAIVVEKCKVTPEHHDSHKFYPMYASIPLKVAITESQTSNTNSVLVFTDLLPVQKHRESVEKAIKTTCRTILPETIRFESYHHHRASNAWLQVADYCAWSIYRKWEHGDDRTYNQLRSHLITEEVDLLGNQTEKYY